MKGIFIAIIIGVLFFALSFFIFTMQHAVLIGLVAFLVTLWTNEGLPLAVVSLLPIILFPSFDILTTKATTANYAHPIIYLFLGLWSMVLLFRCNRRGSSSILRSICLCRWLCRGQSLFPTSLVFCPVGSCILRHGRFRSGRGRSG